jgi:acylphosphatase
VEVLAVGDDTAVQRLRALLRAGPAGAQVSEVEDQKEAPMAEALDPFGILR